MADKGQREFAHAIEPVGVGHPLYVEILPDVDIIIPQPGGGGVQLVEDQAVVDATDMGLFARGRMEVIQLPSFPYEFGQAYGYDAQVILCAAEIDAGLLLVWFYVEQDSPVRGINLGRMVSRAAARDSRRGSRDH